MSYAGLLAERRVWSGTHGTELSIAAIMLDDGSTEIETRMIGHGDGRPIIEWRRWIPLSTALWIADAVQNALVDGAQRIENDGDREEREEHIYAEAYISAFDGAWVRVTVLGRYGTPLLRLDWGIGQESDVAFYLPFLRARELPSALRGAAFVAFDAQETASRAATAPGARQSGACCPLCGAGTTQPHANPPEARGDSTTGDTLAK